MIRILVLLFSMQLIYGQKIFESFDLDGINRYAGTTKYEFDVIEPVDEDKGERNFTIHGVKGDISVEGKIGNTITIIETIQIKTSSDKKAREQFEKERATVTRAVNTNMIEVSGKQRWVSTTSYDYDITLPVNFSVKATTSGGDIEIETVTGEIYLKTSGGDLDLASITGKITGKTSGGDIEFENGEGVLILNTSGGEIDVKNLKGKLDATTSGGDIDVEYIRGDVKVFTSGGSITLYDIFGKSVNAKTSGGDIDAEDIQADLDVTTSGGEISIENIEGSLTAITHGGDIDLENVIGSVDLTTSAGDIGGYELHGSVSAQTSAGDISINKVYDTYFSDHSVFLKTAVGDISLTIPDDFPAKIDAVVKGERSTGAIDCDFPVTVDIKNNEVSCNTTLGEGTYLVKLRAAHGSIDINKE